MLPGNVQTGHTVQKPIGGRNVCDRDGVLALCHCDKIFQAFNLGKGFF